MIKVQSIKDNYNYIVLIKPRPRWGTVVQNISTETVDTNESGGIIYFCCVFSAANQTGGGGSVSAAEKSRTSHKGLGLFARVICLYLYDLCVYVCLYDTFVCVWVCMSLCVGGCVTCVYDFYVYG